MFGRVRAENQLFFLNTGKIEGIQSYSVNNNFGNFTLKYLGVGNKSLNQTVNSEQYADLNIQSYLVQEDIFIQQTGNNPINCFILCNSGDINPYFLLSGYMSSYSAKFAPNQIPQINTSFRFYNNVGAVTTGSLDRNSFLQLSGIYNNIYPNFNNKIADCNYLNLTINESTGNRILDFGFDMNINRAPIYNIGYPPFKRTEIVYPIDLSCDLTFEADDDFIDFNLDDFPISGIKQNIQIDTRSHGDDALMRQYYFTGMTLVANNRSVNVDGNVSIVRKYIGQIFN